MTSLKSYNPATGDVVGEVPITSLDDIPGIVERSRAVQPAWEAHWRARWGDGGDGGEGGIGRNHALISTASRHNPPKTGLTSRLVVL